MSVQETRESVPVEEVDPCPGIGENDFINFVRGFTRWMNTEGMGGTQRRMRRDLQVQGGFRNTTLGLGNPLP